MQCDNIIHYSPPWLTPPDDNTSYLLEVIKYFFFQTLKTSFRETEENVHQFFLHIVMEREPLMDISSKQDNREYLFLSTN